MWWLGLLVWHLQSIPLAGRKGHKKESWLFSCSFSAHHTLTSGNSFPGIPMSDAERPDKSKNLSVPVFAENSRDFCCGLWVSYWLNKLYHSEKTACFMCKSSKGDRFVFWIISYIVEGSVGCLHWQAPHFDETCRNWITYALPFLPDRIPNGQQAKSG